MSKQFLKGIATKSTDGSYRVLASTASVDRQGDIVQQSGWDLKNFLNNPVILWAHKYDELPVGKATDIKVTPAGLEMAFQFAPAEANEKAEQVKQLFEGGYLNAVSVGFIPLERNGNIITRSELLEVSIVPVPANQDALRLAMSKGLSIDKIASDIEKGEVADQVAVCDAYEQKWEKWDELTEVISALWTVYFDEMTPVEDFSKLLGETLVLLGQVASSIETDDETMKGLVEKFLNGKTVDETKAVTAWLTKAGRTISDRNARVLKAATDYMRIHSKVLTEAVGDMATHCTAIDEMLASASSDTGSGKAVEVVPAMSKEDLKLLQLQLRAGDRVGEVALATVNRFLGAKEN